jgi:hypothetical protein
VSERTLKQLVGAVVVVAVLWMITALLSGRGGAPGATAALSRFFEGADEASLTAFRVVGPTDSVEIRREGDRWTVNGHTPDSAQVARLWTELEGARVEGLVAANPANHARMGMTADSAHRVELVIGADTRTLLMGNAGSGYATAYVRLPDADEVYLLDGNLRPHVVRSLDDWRDKRIVAVDTSAVHTLAVRRDDDRYTLSRGDSAWTFADGGAPDAGGVDELLMELRDMRATGFLEPTDSLAGLDEGASVIALGADGDTLVAVTMSVGTGDRWARAAGNPVLYRIASFRADRAAPTRERMSGS